MHAYVISSVAELGEAMVTQGASKDLVEPLGRGVNLIWLAKVTFIPVYAASSARTFVVTFLNIFCVIIFIFLITLRSTQDLSLNFLRFLVLVRKNFGKRMKLRQALFGLRCYAGGYHVYLLGTVAIKDNLLLPCLIACVCYKIYEGQSLGLALQELNLRTKSPDNEVQFRNANEIDVTWA